MKDGRRGRLIDSKEGRRTWFGIVGVADSGVEGPLTLISDLLTGKKGRANDHDRRRSKASE